MHRIVVQVLTAQEQIARDDCQWRRLDPKRHLQALSRRRGMNAAANSRCRRTDQAGVAQVALEQQGFIAAKHGGHGGCIGHLAAVQGVLWRSFGIGKFEARAMSAHTTCTGAVSAAVRLGIVGHLDAQRILSRLRQPIADVLDRPPPCLSDLSSATYAADIASLRGEAVDARMFAN